VILEGKNPISRNEFETWHEKSTMAIFSQSDSKLVVGWAVKLINIYLKTRVYIGNDGRPDLIRWIHPPIDGELWKGIRIKYRNNPNIFKKTHCVERIKDITTYDLYKTIINGCSLIAQKQDCLLIEVEE